MYSAAKAQLAREQQQKKASVVPTVAELRTVLTTIIKASETALNKIDPILDERERLLKNREIEVYSTELLQAELRKMDTQIANMTVDLPAILNQVMAATQRLEEMANVKIENLLEDRKTMANINRVLDKY